MIIIALRTCLDIQVFRKTISVLMQQRLLVPDLKSSLLCGYKYHSLQFN